MFEMGAAVGLGLLVTISKLPWQWKLWVTSHPIFIDVVVMVLLLIIHWGTFTGVMVATIGALICSVILSCARWCIGYNKAGKFIPGIFNPEPRTN